MARANTAPAAQPQAQPYQYPTPAMLDAYRGSVNGMPGTATPLYVPSYNTSNLGAPAVGGPMTTSGRLSFRQRLAIFILGADAGSVLFPPQQPLQPIAQPAEFAGIGRQWDYPVGWNTRVPPRSGAAVGFAQLKALADGYDVLRIMIERVKDKVNAQTWSIGMKDEKAARAPVCDEIADFLSYPDKLNCWDDWSRMLLEQVLVYDAPAVWLEPTRGGELYALQIIDGALVSPKIMSDGRLPPPEYGPAYQQVIKGLPAIDYIQPVPKGQPIPVDPTGQPFPELYYRPRNKRVDSVYGYSPVEQIIRTIIGMAQEDWLRDYFTNGSTPDLLLGTPETWSAVQIADMQRFWDSMLIGNLTNRRGTRFIPGGINPIDTKEKALMNTAVQEWLVRVMCFALGLNPMPFVKMMNKGQEETHHAEAAEEGLRPWLEWVANFMNTLIAMKWARRDVVFRWEESDDTDSKTQAEIFKMYLDAKVMHPDEVRVEMGREAMSPDMRDQMDMATFASTANASQLPPEQQAAQDKRDQVAAVADAKRLAAAKPTPQQKAAEKQELAVFMKSIMPAPQAINVAAPVITMPAINLPEIKVEAPAITMPAITVNTPEIKLGDMFVDVGATNVKVDAPKGGGIGKTVSATRLPDGTFKGTIRDGIERTVSATVNADGNVTKEG